MKINLVFLLSLIFLFFADAYFSQVYAVDSIQNFQSTNHSTGTTIPTTITSTLTRFITQQQITEILSPYTYEKQIQTATKNGVEPIITDLQTQLEQQDNPIENIETVKESIKEVSVPKSKLSPTELDSIFDRYATEYGIDSSVLKFIAKCESNFNPTIISKNGLYAGLYQYSQSTWISTRRAMNLDENPELRLNAQEAIHTTAFKISQGGIGAWPTCGKHALAQTVTNSVNK